jgi:hypothetical protein
MVGWVLLFLSLTLPLETIEGSQAAFGEKPRKAAPAGFFVARSSGPNV